MDYIYALYILPLLLSLGLSGGILHRSQMQSIRLRGTERITVNMGGMAIFPILMMALCLTLGISRWLEYYDIMRLDLGITGDRILQVISGCGLLYIVGLKTDFHGTFAHTKFWALLAATAMFPLSGLWIRDLQGICGIHALSPWVGIPMTIALTMFITESIALLDDIDGLGIGVVAIMLAIFFGLSLTYGFTLGILITAAGLGICIPYSVLKLFAPTWRKTLVGYAGSYPMGYILSYATLSLIHPAGIEMPGGTLMIVLGIILVPVFDLLRSLHQRIQEGRSLLTPDRNLMQHRLIRMGVPTCWTPFCIILLISTYAAFNTTWAILGYNLTLLAITDIVTWSGLQVGISFLIRQREERLNQSTWDMTYGREVWEADTPVETIRHKHLEYGTLGVAPEFIRGEEIDFIPDGMSAFERNTKRLIDLFISAILLLVFSPLFLLCYVLIRMEDGGSAIYSQERIGRFGRPFQIYKFRSMRPDAEVNGPALSTANKSEDPRLTRVGRFLRTHHLDELPQLWNVFIGDMSFIGYRPERKYYIDQIMQHDPRYAMLYQIRPGVTSYATLYNGYTDTMEKMLRRLTYDLYYLEHRSFQFDTKVLWDTFIAIVFGRKF